MASVLLTRSLLGRLAGSGGGGGAGWAAPVRRPEDPALYEGTSNLSTDLMCRVCSRSACTPLTERISVDCDIMCAIRNITDVTINIDDSFPKYICAQCLAELKVAMAFKSKCEQTDKKFRSMTGSLSVTTKSPYPYSKHDFQFLLHQMQVKRQIARDEQQRVMMKREKRLKRRTEKKEKVKTKKCAMKKFSCLPCNLQFTDKDKLQAHRKLRKCIRHPCDICGQPVLSISQHMRISHQQDNVHKCDKCGKGFPIIARLRSHMLVHTDTFNFYCDMCPYRCKHKYYLVMHMRTHTGEKPYKCSACDATFVNPSNLNKHKLMHIEKQFKCGMCDKAFRTAVALREHVEAAHMNMKHSCNYCGRDFCYKSDLRKHEIRYHNRAKRDYVGGEPTYKQVERMQRKQEGGIGGSTYNKIEECSESTYKQEVEMQRIQESELDKWSETANPSATVSIEEHVYYTYGSHSTPVEPAMIVPHSTIESLPPTIKIMPELSLKKEVPTLYSTQTDMEYFH